MDPNITGKMIDLGLSRREFIQVAALAGVGSILAAECGQTEEKIGTTPHENYFEISADSHYALGVEEGKLFREASLAVIEAEKSNPNHKVGMELSTPCWKAALQAFPDLMEELKGYADGSRLPIDDIWMSLAGELFGKSGDKCSSVITNDGLLVAHNEDWDADRHGDVCLLKRQVKDFTTFDLFYYNTLGGNAISINSAGFAQTVNTLAYQDEQVGVPRNVVARWLSETRDPDADYQKLTGLQRASGYKHNIVSRDGKIWNIECSAGDQMLTKPEVPFVHTNHFLTKLYKIEKDDGSPDSVDRYNHAASMLKESMSIGEMKALLGDWGEENKQGIRNEMTVARVILDLEQMEAHAWLLTEEEKG